MAMRCGDCKHWGDGEDAGQVFRVCRAVPFDERGWAADGEGEGSRLAYSDPDDEDHAERAAMRSNRAVTCDGSGFFAALRCREDFGCVLFEPAATQSGPIKH